MCTHSGMYIFKGEDVSWKETIGSIVFIAELKFQKMPNSVMRAVKGKMPMSNIAYTPDRSLSNRTLMCLISAETAIRKGLTRGHAQYVEAL